MDGEDIEARAAVHDATRVTVHYLDAFHAALFPFCSPQFLFSLYLAGRRMDGVHETRTIYRSRNGTSQIVWTPECQTSLDHAKQALADAVLAEPLDADEYKLKTDASHGR